MLKMVISDVFFSDGHVNSVLSDLYLDVDNKSKVTFSNEDICTCLLFRHGEKLLFDLPIWVKDATVFIKQQWSVYLYSRQHQLERMYKAVYTNYEPLENYNRIESYSDTTDAAIVLSKTGAESCTDSGNDVNTNKGVVTTSKNGSENVNVVEDLTNNLSGTDNVEHSGKEIDSNNGTDTMAFNGSQSSTDSGTDTTVSDGITTDKTSVKHSERPFNYEQLEVTTSDMTDNEHSVKGKSDATTYGKKNTIEYNNRNDVKTIDITTTKSYENRIDENIKDLTNKSDNVTDTTTTFTDRNDVTNTDMTNTVSYGKTTTTSFSDRNDTTKNDSVVTHEGRIHGNIGVTTSMTMQSEELKGRLYTLLFDIVDDYVRNICF